MPIATRNHLPLRFSFKDSCVTSSFTLTKFSYSFSSRVNNFTSMEPETLKVSLITWFISSRLAWLSVASL